MRAANGEENSRSTLITGMPASIASVATSVRAAPSVGSRTIASTLLLMKVSTWAIWALGSLVPSALWKSMSSYFSASACALLLIAASQPWSAAGPEKPIVTVSPVSSFELAAFSVPPLVSPVGSGSLLVQPVSTTAETARAATPVSSLRRRGRVETDMVVLLVVWMGSEMCRGACRITGSCWTAGRTAAAAGRRPR